MLMFSSNNSLPSWLEKLVADVQELTKDKSKWPTLVDRLKADPSREGLKKQQIRDALHSLDPYEHSLGYLFLLSRMGNGKQADAEYLNALRHFLQVCSGEQIQCAVVKFVQLAKDLLEQAVLLKTPKAAIAPLLAGITKLSPSQEYITPLHAYLFQVCAMAKCYNAALPALSEEASELDPEKTGLQATEYLLYCYYGAIIHIGRKSYPEALQLLLQALTAPTNVNNAITIAAYKKYAIVSLLQYGHLKPLPKFTSSAVHRSLKGQELTPYSEIAATYKNSNQQLAAAINKHASKFENDGNMGLLKLIVEAQTKRAIQRLTSTYITLSLQRIADDVGLQSAEQAELFLLRMIEAQDIQAEIDDASSIVRFDEDVEEFNSTEYTIALDAKICQCMKLAKKLQNINHEISFDKALLGKSGGTEEEELETGVAGHSDT